MNREEPLVVVQTNERIDVAPIEKQPSQRRAAVISCHPRRQHEPYPAGVPGQCHGALDE